MTVHFDQEASFEDAKAPKRTCCEAGCFMTTRYPRRNGWFRFSDTDWMCPSCMRDHTADSITGRY